MNHSRFFFILNCFLSIVGTIQGLTQTDLDGVYQQVQQQFNDDLTFLANLKDQTTSKEVAQQITIAQQNIKLVYDRTLQYLEPVLKMPITQQTTTLINTQVANAISQISRTQTLISNAITQLKEQIGWKDAKSSDVQAVEQQSQEQQKFFEKMKKLMSLIAPIIDQLQRTESLVRNFVLQLKSTGTYSTDDLVLIINQYKSEAQAAKTAYQQIAVQPNAQDSMNTVSVIMRRLIDFFNEILRTQTQQVRVQQKKPDFFKNIANLSLQLLGNASGTTILEKQGYTSFIQTLAADLFVDSTPIMHYYFQAVIPTTLSLFRAGLAQLASQVQDPTPDQVLYAQHVYDALTSELRYVNQNQSLLVENANNLGIVYVNYATTILTKTLTPPASVGEAVTAAIQAFKKAAELFAQGGRSSQATTYDTLSQALQQGMQHYAAAQQLAATASLDDALAAYRTAQNFMKAGGNMVAVDFINTTILSLITETNEQRARTLLQGIPSSINNSMRDLLQLLATGNGDRDIAPFSTALMQLRTIANSLTPLYQNIVDAYQPLGPSQTPSQNKLLQTMTQTEQAAKSLVEGLDALLQADQNARDLLSAGLVAADALYQKADLAFSVVDKALSDAVISGYIPLLASFNGGNEWTYQKFAAAYMAYLYVWLGSSISVSNGVLSLQYYVAAQAKHQLPMPLSTAIANYIATFEQQKQKIQLLFDQAQANEKIARSLSADQWKSTSSDKYESSASLLWKSILDDYWTAFKLGNAAALESFTNALLFYSQLYQANVPTQFFPYEQSALILLEAVAANSAYGDIAQANDILQKEVLPRLNKFFDQGQLLVHDIANVAINPTMITSLKQLSDWDRYASQFVKDQPALLATYGSLQTTPKLLIEMTTNTDGTHSYQLPASNRLITLPPLALTHAQLQNRLGDFYFNQRNYQAARQAYGSAIEAYNQLNQTSQSSAIQARYNISTTLYYANYYYTTVEKSPNTNQIGPWQVPMGYNLSTYAIMVPEALAKIFPPNLDQIRSDAQQLSLFAITTAIDSFIYYSLEFAFGAAMIDSLFPIIKGAVQSGATPSGITNLSSNQQARLQTIINNAKNYGANLRQRIANKTSNLVLEGLPPKNGIPQFKLWESHKPIPKLPDVTPPYQGYPSAYIYYVWALRLFGSSPVTIGSTQLVPGNQPEQVTQLQNELLMIWLSQGYELQQRINVLKQSPTFIQLANSDKNKPNQSLATFMSLFNQLRNLYLSDDAADFSLISCYHAPFSQNLVNVGTPSYSALLALLAQVNKQAGDDLSNFLLGDPLSSDYYTVINTVAKFYESAIEVFGYNSSLYTTIGDLYRNAANHIKQNGNYFGSIANYMVALQYYKKIANPSAQVSNQIRQTLIEQLTTEFYGATNNANTYKAQRFGNVPISSTDGTTTSIPFATLLAQYLASQNQEGMVTLAAAQQEAIENLKSLLLDSLIFYADSGTQLATQAQSSLISVSDQATLDSQANDLVEQVLKDNTINIADVKGMIALLSRNDFAAIVQKIFDTLLAKATTTDPKQIYLGTKAASLWANKLYFGMGFIYMNDFLGGVSAQTWINLNTAVKARLFSIQANPTQAVG